MPVYSYVGRDVLGRKRKGKVEADDLQLAENIVRSKGIVYIESLKEDKPFVHTHITFSDREFKALRICKSCY
jgi:type IV pilus assembly protein PilC